jgi:hypothetical protein
MRSPTDVGFFVCGVIKDRDSKELEMVTSVKAGIALGNEIECMVDSHKMVRAIRIEQAESSYMRSCHASLS